MTEPISDRRGESLTKRQLSADLYTRTETAPKSQEKASSVPAPQTKAPAFEHITAEQYVKEYIKTDNVRTAPIRPKEEARALQAPSAVIPERTVSTPAERVEQKPPVVEEIKIELPPQNEKVIVESKQDASAEPEARSLEYRIVGEVFNSYVIVERGDTMLLIDKHAAHERIIFEELKERMRSSEPSSQLLLLPIDVMMTSEEIRILDEYRKDLLAIGFEFSVGKYSVSISAIPDGIEIDAVGDMLTVMAERIKENTGSAKLTRDIIFEKALYQGSCKAAIKAGREYAPEHIKWIVDKLMQIPDITFCPHGRPVAMEMSHKLLDRQFERC